MSKAILLAVDDDETIRRLVERCFEGDNDVVVIVFESAPAALVYLRDSTNDRPVVILTDTDMPNNMSGPEFLQVVQEEGLAPHTYCVIMSGGGGESAQKAIYDGHAHRFLKKPFGPLDLKQVLRDTITHIRRPQA